MPQLKLPQGIATIFDLEYWRAKVADGPGKALDVRVQKESRWQA
jgi:hypothetical protein